MNSNILYSIAILLAIFIYLLISGKAKKLFPFTVYTVLTLLPVILVIVTPIFFGSIIILVVAETKDKLLTLPYFIISSEVLVITTFVFIKLNVSPSSAKYIDVSTSNKMKMLDSGRRLLRYSIYANLLYLFSASVTFLYLIIKNRGFVVHILMNPLGSLFAFVFAFYFFRQIMILFVSATTIISIIIVACIFALFFLLLLTSVNGTIRVLYGSKNIRMSCIFYIISLVIPIVNIIGIIHFYRLAKNELESSDASNLFM